MNQFRTEVCTCGHSRCYHALAPFWKPWLWMRGAPHGWVGRCDKCAAVSPERVCQRFTEQPETTNDPR